MSSQSDHKEEELVTESQNFYQQVETPQFGEINCNTSGIYNNGLYDYEYQAINANQLIQQQQTPPQYYVYHPYDYTQIPNGSPVMNTPITPQQQQQQQTPQYYTTYQTMAPYYYDPSGTYTPTQMSSPFSTPVAQPHLSSPQQQSTILASYQTPPQAQHQIYMTPASITPPTSVSPNHLMQQNERSNCNSPQLFANMNHCNQTPTTTNSFMMYTPGNYIQQQQFCHSPSQNYMMFQPQQQQSAMQTQTMVYSPYPVNNTPLISPQLNNSTNKFSGSNKKQRYNNNNNFIQKRNFNQKFVNNTNVNFQSNMVFSPLESIYQNNPILNTQPPGTYDDYLNDESTQKLVDPNVTLYSPPPPQIYCDINGTLIGMPQQDSGDYDAGITSYGDEYDSYDENCNDENDENLACTVCRGRRMCFCYFLKVRYYKFPSFFDLVDHQYKKWRSTMAKAKKA